MLYIMIEEGDKVLGLVDVNVMSESDFGDKVFDCLNDVESEIISDLSFEGVIMSESDMEEYDGEVGYCSFDVYIKGLKEFCEVCLND